MVQMVSALERFDCINYVKWWKQILLSIEILMKPHVENKCGDIRALFDDQLVRKTSQNNVKPIIE